MNLEGERRPPSAVDLLATSQHRHERLDAPGSCLGPRRSLHSPQHGVAVRAVESGEEGACCGLGIERCLQVGRDDSSLRAFVSRVPAPDAEPEAGAFFAGLDRANRYAVLWRVQTAIRPETRSGRIQTLVAMASTGVIGRARQSAPDWLLSLVLAG